jgi:hypothetical protein
VETEIELTFWALPSGIVDRAIPTVKGDAELERLAIQYLKQWRFAPLPKDQPPVEEWGMIPIQFKLQSRDEQEANSHFGPSSLFGFWVFHLFRRQGNYPSSSSSERMGPDQRGECKGRGREPETEGRSETATV